MPFVDLGLASIKYKQGFFHRETPWGYPWKPPGGLEEVNFRKIGLWKGGPFESNCFDSPRSSGPKKEIFFAENLKFFQSPGFFLSPSRKIADLANFKRILQIIDAPSLGIC